MFNCSDIARDLSIEESGEVLFNFSLVSLNFAFVYFPACFLYFCLNRNKFEQLKRRNIFVLAFFCIGLMGYVISFSLRNVIGAAEFPCDVRYFSFSLFIICFSSIGCAFRLVGLYFRVSFNSKLLCTAFTLLQEGELLFKPGKESFTAKLSNNQDINISATRRNSSPETVTSLQYTKASNVSYPKRDRFVKTVLFPLFCWRESPLLPDSVQVPYFFSSLRFINCLFMLTVCLLMCVSLVIYFLRIPPGNRCTGCSITDILIGNSIHIFVFIVLTVLSMVYLRSYVDALGIKNEVFMLGGMWLVVNCLFLTPVTFIFDEIEREGKWDWTMIGTIEFYIMGWYTFVYQVNRAKREERRDKQNRLVVTIPQILSSEEGTKAFALFSSVHLSAENLYFYKAVENWKKNFDSNPSVINNTQAREIFEVYISRHAPLQTNIPYQTRKRLLECFEQRDNFEKKIFNEAFKEVLDNLSTELLPRFLKSKYYTVYQNTAIMDSRI